MAAFPPLKAVRYFEAAARHLSFSKAAEELNVTHSAISHQIKALEEWVGQPLFDRTGRALRLTEGGRQFLPPVRSAFQQLSDAAQRLRSSERPSGVEKRPCSGAYPGLRPVRSANRTS